MVILYYLWIRENEHTPKRWRRGVVVNLFDKGDEAGPRKYRGMALFSTVGDTICKILKESIKMMLGKEEKSASVKHVLNQTVVALVYHMYASSG